MIKLKYVCSIEKLIYTVINIFIFSRSSTRLFKSVSNYDLMLRALLYIFGGLFTAYGLWGILYMIYWGILNGSVEPEMQALNELVTKSMAREIGEAR